MTAPALAKAKSMTSIAIAVHPERRDQAAAGIDHGDGVALVASGGMSDAAGDDRLRGAGVQAGRRRRGGLSLGGGEEAESERAYGHGILHLPTHLEIDGIAPGGQAIA